LVFLVAVIGAPLSLLLDFDGQSRTLPLILKNCMDALRDDEAILKSSTLFRTLPGQEIAEIETKFQSPNLSVNMLLYDANTTANFLLHWLSKLPECLLTNSKYSKFSKVAAIEDSAKSERKLARVVKSLPHANRNALQYLLIFLRELQTHENENKLTTSTLASIFGPILHRRTQNEEDSDADASSGLSQGEGDAPPSLTNQSASIQVVYRLISGYATIFAELILEDKEFIPEDQLNEEVVKAKRKGNTLIRSNSQSIDKPLQRKMVVSSSAENISISPSNSAGSSAVSPIVTTKVNISSSTSVTTSAPAHASPTSLVRPPTVLMMPLRRKKRRRRRDSRALSGNLAWLARTRRTKVPEETVLDRPPLVHLIPPSQGLHHLHLSDLEMVSRAANLLRQPPFWVWHSNCSLRSPMVTSLASSPTFLETASSTCRLEIERRNLECSESLVRSPRRPD
jgi:hypothetical protein